jgi:hypothetical protein
MLRMLSFRAAVCSASSVSRKYKALVGAWPIVAIVCLLAPGMAHAQPTTTITALNITNIPPQNQLPQKVIQANLGVPVSLNATVKMFNGGPVFAGTVVFCEGSVTVCLAGHAIGSQSLVVPTGPQNVGTAHLTIAPTPGTHKYLAVFLGNGVPPASITAQSSTSAPYNFKVIGPYGPTTTTLISSGSPGNYTLNAQVVAIGSRTVKPTGTVGFFDTTNANASLGSAPIGSTAFSFAFSGPVSPQPPNGFPTIFNMLSTVADVNNDGMPDLIMVVPDITVPNQYDIMVMLNSLTGFGLPSQTIVIPAQPSPTAPTAIAAADINNDGNVDLLMAFDNESLVYFFGAGPQGAANNFFFAPSPTTLISPNGFYPYITSLAVADLSNTGFKSIFGTTTIGAFFLPNTNTVPSPATFGSPQYLLVNNAFTTPSAIAVGDFNGDGFTDFAVANPDTNDISLFVQPPQQGGAFQQIPVGTPAGTSPSALIAADFNGDGILDLAVTNFGDDNVNILLGDNNNNTGKNSLFTFTSKSKMATVPEPMYLTQGDFDGDGKIDLAVGNWDGTNITALLGKGDGTFKKSTLDGDSSFGLLSADLNFDGYADIIGIGPTLFDIAVFQSTWSATTNASLTGVAVAGSGTHQVDAAYPGDTNYTGSTSNSIPLTGMPLTTTLQLAGNPSSGTWGQQVALIATLSPYSAQNHSTDGELVTFYNGTTSLGTAPLSLGIATLNVNSLSVGAHTLKAVYGGDTNFSTSKSTISFNVGKAASTTSLSAANIHPKVGNSDLLTAVVTGFSAPRGNVVFRQDGNVICTVPLGATGKATCSYIPWSTTASHLTARYQGDGQYAASISSTLTLTATYTYNASIVITFDSTQLTYPGATNTRTCVTRATSATPTGTVTIYDSATAISVLSLGGDGCAYWWINPGLTAGTHHIRAYYSGDSNNTAGYSAITDVTVSRLQSYMSAACWNSSFQHGGNYQCNVSVWANYAINPPGNITYSLDGGAAKTATLSSGNTSFVITNPPVGNHTVTIAYPGSSNYTSANAPTQNFTVY